MGDYTDDLLNSAFASFEEAAMPYVKPAGLDPVRATVRHRRTVRTTAASILAAIAIIAPVTAYAARNLTDNGPPPVGTSPAVSTAPTATSASPNPNPTASGPAGTATSVTPAVLSATTVDCQHAASTGPVTMAQLCDGTFTLPSSSVDGACAHGKITFKHGVAASGGATLRQIVQVDLDHDGQPETVARYDCLASDPGLQLALGYARAADGTIHVLGHVITYANLNANGDPNGDVSHVVDLGADTAGNVRLQVSNLGGSDGSEYVKQILQWRVYSWDGRHFNQTAGPTSYQADQSAKLTVTTTPLTLKPERNGMRPATLTVTVRNGGGSTIADIWLVVLFDQFPRASGGDCSKFTSGDSTADKCTIGTLAPGAAKSVTLTYSIPAADVATVASFGSSNIGFVQLRVGDQQYSLTTDLKMAG